MNYHFFVSYSFDDEGIVEKIVEIIEQLNLKCWYAKRNMKPGENILEAISKAIDESDCCLFVLSNCSYQMKGNNWVVRELSTASDLNKQILPLRIENVDPTGVLKILGVHNLLFLDAYCLGQRDSNYPEKDSRYFAEKEVYNIKQKIKITIWNHPEGYVPTVDEFSSYFDNKRLYEAVGATPWAVKKVLVEAIKRFEAKHANCTNKWSAKMDIIKKTLWPYPPEYVPSIEEFIKRCNEGQYLEAIGAPPWANISYIQSAISKFQTLYKDRRDEWFLYMATIKASLEKDRPEVGVVDQPLLEDNITAKTLMEVSTLYEKALSLEEANAKEEAYTVMNAAIEIAPTLTSLHYRRYWNALASKRYRERLQQIVDDCKIVLKCSQDDILILNDLARAYDRKKDMEQARLLYNLISELNQPDYTLVDRKTIELILCKWLNAEFSEPMKAKEAYTEAMAVLPRLILQYYGIAILSLITPNYPKHLDQMTKYYPEVFDLERLDLLALAMELMLLVALTPKNAFTLAEDIERNHLISKCKLSLDKPIDPLIQESALIHIIRMWNEAMALEGDDQTEEAFKVLQNVFDEAPIMAIIYYDYKRLEKVCPELKQCLSE